MLTFVGLGLFDERSITLEGRLAIEEAQTVFAEFYTSQLVGTDISTLETLHDTSIIVLDRAGVEIEPEPILAAAIDGHTAFLTAGDPMISTTHVDLRLRAHERGIDTRIVHGTTAQTAASSLTGLQNYRFGRSTSLPTPRSATFPLPANVTDVIDENRSRGLHTIVYLDIDTESNVFMTADSAADVLAAEYDDILGVAIAQAGSPDPTVVANRLSSLASRSFGDPLHLFVIPGDLHRMEAEALRAFGGAPSSVTPSS